MLCSCITFSPCCVHTFLFSPWLIFSPWSLFLLAPKPHPFPVHIRCVSMSPPLVNWSLVKFGRTGDWCCHPEFGCTALSGPPILMVCWSGLAIDGWRASTTCETKRRAPSWGSDVPASWGRVPELPSPPAVTSVLVLPSDSPGPNPMPLPPKLLAPPGELGSSRHSRKTKNKRDSNWETGAKNREKLAVLPREY